MKTTTGWGILGCGKIAKKFAADLRYTTNAKLVAAASRDFENAKSFAKEFHAEKAYGSYEEMVRNPEVDAVYVATPHSHHHQHTLLCLEHNKAVLCEKPLSVNARQAREMIEFAQAKKVFLMEAMWTKFLPHQQKLEALVKEGKIGDIKSVIVNFGFRPQPPIPQRVFDPALAGGTVLDIGIYNVFLVTSILGQPDAIDAHMVPASTGIDEQCAILFRYKNGAMAQMLSSFVSDLPTDANISGTRGRIKLTNRFYAPDSTIRYYAERADSFEIIESGFNGDGLGYQFETQHVGECLSNGLTESPVIPLSDTLKQMELLDEIRRIAGITYAEDR